MIQFARPIGDSLSFAVGSLPRTTATIHVVLRGLWSGTGAVADSINGITSLTLSMPTGMYAGSSVIDTLLPAGPQTGLVIKKVASQTKMKFMSGALHLFNPNGAALRLTISNLAGRTLCEKSVGKGSILIKMSDLNLAAGVYIARMNGHGVSVGERFIVR